MDGAVRCWGQGSLGSLGDNLATQSNSPVVVSGLTDATMISTAGGGGAHTCALRAAGGVVCWGFNVSGQLGTGDFVQANRPMPVVGL